MSSPASRIVVAAAVAAQRDNAHANRNGRGDALFGSLPDLRISVEHITTRLADMYRRGLSFSDGRPHDVQHHRMCDAIKRAYDALTEEMDSQR